jgi:hypothetical protein
LIFMVQSFPGAEQIKLRRNPFAVYALSADAASLGSGPPASGSCHSVDIANSPLVRYRQYPTLPTESWRADLAQLGRQGKRARQPLSRFTLTHWLMLAADWIFARPSVRRAPAHLNRVRKKLDLQTNSK